MQLIPKSRPLSEYGSTTEAPASHAPALRSLRYQCRPCFALIVIDFDECSNSRVPISPLSKRFEQLLAPASPPGEP